MSFVVAEPELVQAAAQNLANLRDTLAEASASAAAPTTGVVAAAEDEVSALVAQLFGSFGQEYQMLSAQAQAFHAQFVNLLNAGAGAYLSTEVANAEQSLVNAVEGSVQGLFGQSLGGAASASAAAGLPGLGGGLLDQILGGGTGVGVSLPVSLGNGTSIASLVGSLGGGSLGQSLNGVVTGLENGALSLLPGQLGAGLPTLQSLESLLAPGLLQTGASTGLATIAGPYETLFAHTAQNLQAFDALWSANPAPFLHQVITNQIGYAQTIAANLQYLVQNLPTVLANLPANIQAAIQALLTFNPAPYVQQFINNQIAYAHIIGSSLQSAAYDFGTGLQGLPAALQSASQALQTGDVTGAVTDVAKGFANLFVTGVDVSTTGSINIPGTSDIIAAVAPTGALGDLLPILSLPGMMTQNFTNLLPVGSIPAQISQNLTNVINTITNTSITAEALLTVPSAAFSLTNTFGLPLALSLDAVGAPVNALEALNTSATAFVSATQAGNWAGAAAAFIDVPAVVADGFLNGQTTLPLTFALSGLPITVGLPFDGVLVPQTAYTASIDLGALGTITVPVGGTPLSGLLTGLYNGSVELADAII